ncbi:hypothetical protein [Aquimarina sediminis]|uniref:hypothetical protein n=1 Tax=Aquimarina sediminis TaxID=2070536 RepID=UPI000CA07627|nr:hypothetical protein [Aquimarina sediminis]
MESMVPSITEIITHIFFGLAASIPQVFIVVICLYYIFKKGSKIEGVLLVSGSILSLLCALSTQIGVLFSQVWGADSYLTYTYVFYGISFIGSVLFVIGFFILVRKTIKHKVLDQY